MGATTRRALKQRTREAAGDAGAMPDDWLDDTLAHFDQGTQRAILRLYRSSPPDALAQAGARLGAHRPAPRSSSGATAIRTSRPASPTPTPRRSAARPSGSSPARRRPLAVDRAPELVDTVGAFLAGGDAPARGRGRSRRGRRPPRRGGAGRRGRSRRCSSSSTRRAPTWPRTSTAPTSFGPPGFGAVGHGWYAGHHLPGYSVLFPPPARCSGRRSSPRRCAVVAAVVLRATGPRLVARPRGDGRPRLWFAVASSSTLVGGPAGVRRRARAGARRAARARRAGGRAPRAAALRRRWPRRWRARCAARVPRPRARIAWGLAAARARARRSRRPRGALVPGLLIALAFPRGRHRSRSPSRRSAWRWRRPSRSPSLLPPRERVLRIGALLYAVALIAGDRDRHAAGRQPRPARARSSAGRSRSARCGSGARPRMLPLLARRRSLYWQWLAPVRDRDPRQRRPVERGAPTTAAARRARTAHAPRRARSAPRSRSRPTTGRRATSRRAVPLARGWERQLDVKLQRALLRRRRADAGALPRAGSTAQAVRYVALPGARLDPSGAREGALVRAGRVPGLREVWRGGDWRLFARRAATRPLARRRRSA